MPADSISPSARITAAFAKLTDSAKHINAVSDELSKPILSLERALQRLNIGVACWTLFSEFQDSDCFWRQYVGYALVKGEWRIVIQTSEGSDYSPERSNDETWPFDDAPRYLRVKAVDKLPDLIEALVKTADATAERLKQKVEPAKELAAAVNALISPKKK